MSYFTNKILQHLNNSKFLKDIVDNFFLCNFSNNHHVDEIKKFRIKTTYLWLMVSSIIITFHNIVTLMCLSKCIHLEHPLINTGFD